MTLAVVAQQADAPSASTDAGIAAEVAFLRAALDARIPVLGICFGAQALAAALGAPVTRVAAPSRGSPPAGGEPSKPGR